MAGPRTSWYHDDPARILFTVGFVLVLLIVPPAGPFHPNWAPSPAGASVGAPRNSTAGETDSSPLAIAERSLTASWGFSPVSAPRCQTSPSCWPSAGRSGAAVPSISSPPPARVAFNPPPLIGASLVYDAADGYVLMFGGLYSTNEPSNQTWEYLGGSWLNITPFLGTSPQARWDASMAYDAQDRYVLLFGGCGGYDENGLCTNTFSDTWDYFAGAWQLLIPNKPPPPAPPPPNFPPSPGFSHTGLWDASVTYDASFDGGSVLLYGGASGLFDLPPPPPPSPPTNSFQISDYTWSWSAGVWTNDTSSNTSATPPAVYGAGLATGPPGSGAVLFGGTNLTRYDVPVAPGSLTVEYDAANVTGGTSNETWMFSSSGIWSQAPEVSGGPAGRFDFAMGYEPGSPDILLIYGGTSSSGVYYADAWQLGGAAPPPGPGPPPPPPVWTEIHPGPGPVPGPRWDSAFTFDPADGVFLLYGGRSVSGSALWDLWTLGRGLTPLWTPGSSQPVAYPPVPSPRYEGALTFDDQIRGAVLFGGEACGSAACTFLGDTWTFYQGSWREWTPNPAPPARYGASFAYDPVNGNVYLFGGCGSPCPRSDTWVYRQATPTTPGTWTQLFPPVSPPGRYFASLTFDPEVNAMILFGGCEGSLGPCPTGDTWSLSGGGTWTDLGLAPSESPPPRFGAAATFVPGGRMYLVGGMGSNGLLTDTWYYGALTSVGTLPLGGPVTPSAGRYGWNPVPTLSAPPGRVFGLLAYDEPDDALLLSGGCVSSGCPSLSPWFYTLVTPPPPPPGQPPPLADPWSAVPGTSLAIWNTPAGASYGVAGVWDPEGGPSGFVLEVGGRITNGETMGSAFEFAGAAWLDIGPVS